MRRTALYSRASRLASQQPAPAATTPGRMRTALSRISPSSPRVLWSAIALLALLLVLSLTLALKPGARRLTQEDIDKAVLHTLNTNVLPSAASKAYEKIAPSVVRVVSYGKVLDKAGKETGQEVERGVGTGVVIVDKGVILTNLHVVSGAQTIKVTFFDGLESIATITGVQAENDLAVLQAQKIPDDMIAATMRSTGDLLPGDQVVAVGFPFGIGPSASAGIVSGLKRAFRSHEGKQEMTNLIQFDAAANPGNSGGPLVTMDGEVVGIVTAILNPTSARTFIGIGFAVPIENAAAAAGLPPF
ncbi:MAG: trypsin-like peptidase domain-containing protein [Burkholderiaceae bacterium]|nr:trypsin-like peptidase domain-containing protein [Burkholderiaceae bacterium]